MERMVQLFFLRLVSPGGPLAPPLAVSWALLEHICGRRLTLSSLSDLHRSRDLTHCYTECHGKLGPGPLLTTLEGCQHLPGQDQELKLNVMKPQALRSLPLWASKAP